MAIVPIDDAEVAYELDVATGPTTTFAIPVPTAGGALVAGDVLVAMLTFDLSSTTDPTVTWPSGWVSLWPYTRVGTTASASMSGEARYHIVTAGEVASPPANWPVTLSTAVDGSIAVQRFRGVDTADPIAVSSPAAGYSTVTQTTGTATKVAPAVTTDAANAMLITGGSARSGSATLTSVTTGYTVGANAWAIGGKPSGIAYQTQAAAGASGAATWTHSGSFSGLAWQSALKEATGGGGDTTAPTVPGNVQAAANSSTQVTVTWNASTDAVGVTSYRVRQGGIDVPGHTAVAGTSAVITGLTASTAYSFTVSAVDAAGNRSAESTAAAVTTPAGGGGTPTLYTLRYESTTAAPTLPADAALTASNITAGAGATLQIPYSGTEYNPNKVWQIKTLATARPTLADAIANDLYAEITVSRTGGWYPKTLRVKGARGGSTTPRGFAIRSSVDGYAADLMGADLPTVRPTLTQYSADISSMGLQAGSVTFRLYHYSPAGGSTAEHDDWELDYEDVAAATPADVVGVTATATAAAPAGVVDAGTAADVVGVVATATAAAPAGLVDITAPATVAGVVAGVTAAAPAGVLAADATVSGTAAAVTAAAPAGVPQGGGAGIVVGVTAAVTADAPAGQVQADAEATVSGVTATVTADAPAGTGIGATAATVAGVTATVTATSPAGVAQGGAEAVVTGVTATVTADATAGAPAGGGFPVPVLNSSFTGYPDTTGIGVSTNTTNAVSVRLAASTDPTMASGVLYGPPATPNAQGDAQLTIAGLTPSSSGTAYVYRIAMTNGGGTETLDNWSDIGQFRTNPTGRVGVTFSAGSCANGSTTDSAAFGEAADLADDLWVMLGDAWYADGSGTGVANYRAKFDDRLAGTPNFKRLVRTRPGVWGESDHDFSMNNGGSAGTDATAAANWNQVLREKIATPPLPATTGNYWTKPWGTAVRVIKLDTRSFKSNPANADNASKTVLGATQKQWLKETITNSPEQLFVLPQGEPWIGSASPGEDDWRGYTTERTELANFFAASGKHIIMLAGDMHALAADDGTNAPGGIVVYHCAPWNRGASIKGGPYTAGPYPASGTAAVQQRARISIVPNGDGTITSTYQGFSAGVATPRLTQVDTFAAVPASATVAGATATGSAAAPAGQVVVSAAVAGVTAAATAGAAAGQVTAAATVAGVVATATAAATVGAPTADATVPGTSAAVTAGAPAGLVDVSASATVAGVVAAATAAAPAGALTAGAIPAGVTASATAAAPAGSIAAAAPALVAGVTAGATAGAPAGSLVASATVVGQLATVTLAALAGMASAGVRQVYAPAGWAPLVSPPLMWDGHEWVAVPITFANA